MKQPILLLLLIFLTISCKNKSLKEYKKDFYQFDRQVSPNSKFKIYRFCKSGSAFSGDLCENLIFEKKEKFAPDKGYNINGEIGHWISNDTLEIYRFNGNFEQPKDTIGKITFENYKGLTLKVKNYSSVNSGGSNEYSFDSFEIKSDKICLNGIKKILGPEMEKQKCFNYGNIEILNSSDTLTKLIITTVETSMNFQYQNADGTIRENLPEVKILSTDYYPKNKTKALKEKEFKGVFFDIK